MERRDHALVNGDPTHAGGSRGHVGPSIGGHGGPTTTSGGNGAPLVGYGGFGGSDAAQRLGHPNFLNKGETNL